MVYTTSFTPSHRLLFHGSSLSLADIQSWIQQQDSIHVIKVEESKNAVIALVIMEPPFLSSMRVNGMDLNVRSCQRFEPRLAVFDMDSTLIQQEVIDELAREIGVYDQVQVSLLGLISSK
jgi:hypothetical protein